MAVNYARPTFDPKVAESLQKPRPRMLVKRAAKATVSDRDRQEREKCHARSHGQCEVLTPVVPLFVFDAKTMKQKPVTLMAVRCKRRASENHHLIGGIGRRNRGRSILAEHRLDVCQRCHDEITGKVLVPAVSKSDAEVAAKVVYERRK